MDSAETYANLISDSLIVKSSLLESNLDSILATFANYITLIERSEIEIDSFEQHLRPTLHQKQTQLEEVYSKLDDLQIFVDCLNQSCAKLEHNTELAEKKFSLRKMNKLKGFIDSKLFAKTGQECEPQAFVVACDKVFAKQDMENDAS